MSTVGAHRCKCSIPFGLFTQVVINCSHVFVSVMEAPDPDFVLRGADGPITSLGFVSDAGPACHLLSGTQNGTLCLWNLRSRRALFRQPAAHSGSVLYVSDIGNGAEIVTQGRDGIIQRWSVADGRNWTRLGLHNFVS